MDIQVIITGAAGFVRERLLLACLDHWAIVELAVVYRKHFDLQHPKLKGLIVPDF